MNFRIHKRPEILVAELNISISGQTLFHVLVACHANGNMDNNIETL
jgi:hypothetical protein